MPCFDGSLGHCLLYILYLCVYLILLYYTILYYSGSVGMDIVLIITDPDHRPRKLGTVVHDDEVTAR